MKLSLKEFFAGFLRTRHFGRHFRRLALLDSLTNTTVSREVPPTRPRWSARCCSSPNCCGWACRRAWWSR